MTPYEKFQESGQAAVKLKIALQEYFKNSVDNSQNCHRKTAAVYEEYLRTRKYPALKMLVEEQNISMLRALLATGWITGEQRHRALFDHTVTNTQIRAILMGAKSVSDPENHCIRNPKEQIECWGRRAAIEFPALRLLLTTMTYEECQLSRPIGMNDSKIFYDSTKFTEDFKLGNGWNTYLHMITHGIFRHTQCPGNISIDVWNTACDVSAEYWREQLFTSMGVADNHRWELFPKEISCEQPAMVISYLMEYQDSLSEIYTEFLYDDHSPWYQKQSDHKAGIGISPEEGTEGSQGGRYKEDVKQRQKQWQKVREEFLRHKSRRRPHYGLSTGSRREKAILREEGKYNFENYLKRFHVVREEMQLDMDSFDYIAYTYGMNRYGNLPLLEPLEYTEASKVEELVIAIDTSGSCKKEIVSRFLAECKKILTNQEAFFKKMQVYILQCDSMIQKSTKITSVEEWDAYIDGLVIEGRGGTDFMPVFTHVEKLQKTGELNNLKGLLYFTDGDGIYPRIPTEYETAFVFLDERFLEYQVPDWIVKLCLKETLSYEY